MKLGIELGFDEIDGIWVEFVGKMFVGLMLIMICDGFVVYV
jgi:hypothetical protein